jgi:multiple sugar transport system substrate-binding protein
MRKRFLKQLSIILSLILILTFGAGFSLTTKNATSKASSAQKVKIVYAQWGASTEGDALHVAIKKFEATYPNIEVSVMTIPWETYMTKINTMTAAGQAPDCALMKEDSVLQWASQGMLADISSMYGPKDSKPLDSLAFKYKGKTVAYSAANEILLMYYNKDMFDKAGIAYPPATIAKAWTWDQFVAVAKKLTFDKNGKHPDEAGFDPQNIKQYGCLVENLTWQLETWCLSNGGGYYSKDGSKVIINNPASVEAIQKVADLYLKDHVAPLSIGTTDDSIQRSIINKTCAMGTGGAWNVGTCLNDAKAKGLHYGVAVLPYMKTKVTLNTGGPNVVLKGSKHAKEAMEFIKFYSKEENSWSLISSGIWMPVLQKWYTDPTLLHKWIDNPNFPKFNDYKATVVDTATNKNVVHQASWYNVQNTVDFNTLLGSSVLGDVWTGKTTAKDAINNNIDKLNAVFSTKK